MNVSGLTQFDPSKFFQTPTTASAPQRLDTKVSAVSASTDLSGQLTVTTAEGDKVTLTANLEAQFRAVNYQGQVQTDNGTVDVKAKSVEASFKREFGVTVEGDLNDQELSDLAKLFRRVTNIFRKFFNGQDDEAQAKTAKLAEKFGNLSSLSGLDLSVDVQRSVTVVAAQLSSQTAGQPTAVPDQTAQPTTTSTQTGSPSDAPAATAASAEPSKSTPDATTADKPATADPAPADDSKLRLVAPAQDDAQTKSLAQQVLDALQDSKVDAQKVRKYLPDFFKKLREDLGHELQDKQAQNDQKSDTQPATTPDPTTAPAPAGVTAAVFAYQSFSQTSIRLSIHS